MTWLVTGGAGYIGAHVAKAFVEADIDVVVLDSLAAGRRDFVPDGVPLVEGSVLDGRLVSQTLAEHEVSGVVHLAGFKYAGVSVERPVHTYAQNVAGTVVLLEQMAEHGVDRLVFSSSAATYGTPDTDLVTEKTPTTPESPYGRSKLIGEWMLADTGRATDLVHTSLRYFNVVGSGEPSIFDVSPHNLFPLVFRALSDGRTPVIFGDDYDTPDGTCVRDYIHVADVALAHVRAAEALDSGHALEPVYNLGSGDGVSVREIMTTVAEVTGTSFEPDVAPRRPGDPARIVASGDMAARDLDWTMRHSLTEMVESAWRAHQLSGG